MRGRNAEVFLSYCWADEKIADKIYDNLILSHLKQFW